MILKHKDRELLHFDWVKPFGVKNVELNARELQWLPLEFREKAEKGVSRDLVWGLEDWLVHRTVPMTFESPAQGGPIKIEFIGPGRLLQLIRENPCLRKNTLARLVGLTERTTKRYLSQLKGEVIFVGAPKTGGYHISGKRTAVEWLKENVVS